MTRKRGTLPYRTSHEHLLAELDWLDGALLALIRASGGGRSGEGGHGWFVSREEAERLLVRNDGPIEANQPATSLLRKRRTIAARRQASADRDIRLTLATLGALFHLSPAEELLLMACLAAERDDRYGRVFGYLHDDLTRQQPSIQLIARLARLDPSLSETPALEALVVDANLPLFQWQLVVRDGGTEKSHVACGWSIDRSIAGYLLERAERDVGQRPAGFADEGPPAGEAAECDIWNGIQARPAGVVVFFHGPGAVDGHLIAERTCQRLGAGLVHADLALLLDAAQTRAAGLDDDLRRLYRQALLQGAALYLSGFERVRSDVRGHVHVRSIERLSQETSCVTFVEGEGLWLPGTSAARVSFLPVHLAATSFETRREVWRRALGPRIESRALEMLAARYRFSTANVERAVRLATTHAAVRAEDVASYDDVMWACRLLSKADLDGLAQTISPRARWHDLILPAPVLEQLHDICAHARHRATVLNEWGFDRMLSTGKGVYALFTGPGGTGKTLAAEVLANTLDFDLVKVDLSSVVSKYIGETERNLQRVFDATEHSDAILFFDEADALFGKRTEIRDAHDRYANIEVGFLLQRLDSYEGFTILASNLASNVDPAFARRMQFAVEFPFPEESERLAIWKRHLPPEMPVADDVDLVGLSRELKVAGGNIRNIVLNAAYLAADDSGVLGMRHLQRAAQREYTRLGKVHRFHEATAREALA